MADTVERRARPIYDAIDETNWKQALALCAKALKKDPNCALILALKAYALERSGKSDEALAICDGIRKSPLTDSGTLEALTTVYKAMCRYDDICAMYEEAAAAVPAKTEDFTTQAFLGAVRGQQFLRQQQIAGRLNKLSPSRRHLCWSLSSVLMQAVDARGTDQARLPLMLADKMVKKAIEDKRIESLEEFSLCLQVLEEGGDVKGMVELVDGSLGRAVFKVESDRQSELASLLRRLGHLGRANAVAKALLARERRDDWSLYTLYLDTTVALADGHVLADGDSVDGADASFEAAAAFLQTAPAPEHASLRGPYLAVMDLARRLLGRANVPAIPLAPRLLDYFARFGAKFCFFSDALPYLSALAAEERAPLVQALEGALPAEQTVERVRRLVSLEQTRAALFPPTTATAEANVACAVRLYGEYLAALPLGANLEPSERQHGDDLLLLAAHALFYSFRATGEPAYLLHAASLADFGLRASQQNFQLRLFAVAAYAHLGALPRALELYEGLSVKQIQHDTLSHYGMDYFTDLALFEEAEARCAKTLSIYGNNRRETPEMLAQAYLQGSYHKAREFVAFYRRLDNSVQRHLQGLELRRAWLVLGDGGDLGAQLRLLEQFPAADFSGALLPRASENRDRTVMTQWGTPDLAADLRVAPLRGVAHVAAGNAVFRALRLLGAKDAAAELAAVADQLGAAAADQAMLVLPGERAKLRVARLVALAMAAARAAQAASADDDVVAALAVFPELVAEMGRDDWSQGTCPIVASAIAAHAHALEALGYVCLLGSALVALLPTKKARRNMSPAMVALVAEIGALLGATKAQLDVLAEHCGRRIEAVQGAALRALAAPALETLTRADARALSAGTQTANHVVQGAANAFAGVREHAMRKAAAVAALRAAAL